LIDFREREHKYGEGQRERERILKETVCVKPHMGLNPMTLRSSLELKSRVGHSTT